MNVRHEAGDCSGSSTTFDEVLSGLDNGLKESMQQQRNNSVVAANALQSRTYQCSSNSRRCHAKGKQKQHQHLNTNDKRSHQQNHDIIEHPDNFNDDNTRNKYLPHDKCFLNGTIINDTQENVAANHFCDSCSELPKQCVTPSNKNEINKSYSSEAEHEQDRDNDNDDWEKMFDDSGECLDDKIDKLTTTIKRNLKIEQNHITAIENIETPFHNRFHEIEKKQGDKEEAEFSHVLEASNFPVEFRTQDLFMIFSQYKEPGFDVKWVDDTHALLVFSSSHIANEVLNTGHPLVVLKPLKSATFESKMKAKKCALYIQPYKPRPETCVALARRLVTGALGLRLKTAAIERENEKRILNKARERKLQALQQQQKQRDNWDS